MMQRTFAMIKPDAVAAKNSGKIIDMIEKNGLLPDGVAPEHEVQDSKTLLNAASPFVNATNIANKVTDVAATADRLWHGDGLKFKQNKLLHKLL